MKKLRPIMLLALAALLGSVTLSADDDDGLRFKTRLSSYEETPQTLSTPGRGTFRGRISEDGSSISYKLTYSDLQGAITTAAHIHLGQRGTTGGVIAFICGGGGKPACTNTSGTFSGTWTAADIVGPNGQGIAPGEIAEVIAAIEAGFVYVNVHTNLFPSGEIRGQLRSQHDD
jgi:hypothetical protein